MVLYFAIDIIRNLDLYKEKITFDKFSFYITDVPVYVMSAFIFLVMLMLVELVAENFQIITLKKKVKKAEEEVLKYKARLYDRSQGEEDEEDEEEADQEEEKAKLPQFDLGDADDDDD